MKNLTERQFVSRIIYYVLTQRCSVRNAIVNFPNSKDKSIQCAYHALIHYEADEELRYKDIEYKETQDDYLEFIAQELAKGNDLPRNIISDYEPYYKDIATKWIEGSKGFTKEFLKFININ